MGLENRMLNVGGYMMGDSIILFFKITLAVINKVTIKKHTVYKLRFLLFPSLIRSYVSTILTARMNIPHCTLQRFVECQPVSKQHGDNIFWICAWPILVYLKKNAFGNNK